MIWSKQDEKQLKATLRKIERRLTKLHKIVDSKAKKEN